MILALDIGNVVATIDKKSFNDFLKEHHVPENTFYDEDFLLLQIGQISPENFFFNKCHNQDYSFDRLFKAFKNMVSTHNAKELIKKIRTPYFFMSNINQIHYEEFLAQTEPSHFAKRFSRLSYQVGCLKPDERFFISLDQLDMPLSSLIFIDDRAENLIAAQTYGLTTLHCPHEKALPRLLQKIDAL